MRRAAMHRLLQQVLVLAAPFTLSDCLVSSSGCPDAGHRLPIPRSEAVEPSLADGGQLDAANCRSSCGDPEVITCVRESAGTILCLSRPEPCEGRRPPGLKPAPRTSRSGFALHLADAAWLEAASVDAFRVLRRELQAHGAPRRLLRAASRSARDERRHARIAGALARRFGVAVAPVQRDVPPLRSLAQMALENAVEGCVRETWGALIALRQAARAAEPSVRAAMSRIAPDEVRHAQLAWAVDRWLMPRLDADQRRRAREARSAALAQLAHDARHELTQPERDRLGLPDAAESLRLLAELTRALGLTAAA